MDLGNLGDGDNDNKVIGEEDPPIGAPRGIDIRLEGSPQPQPARREFLCEKFFRIEPPSFEGSAKFFDAEEWLASIEIIFNFMELNDDEKIICVACVLETEARYCGK